MHAQMLLRLDFDPLFEDILLLHLFIFPLVAP